MFEGRLDQDANEVGMRAMIGRAISISSKDRMLISAGGAQSAEAIRSANLKRMSYSA
jgi:hypothetical protein